MSNTRNLLLSSILAILITSSATFAQSAESGTVDDSLVASGRVAPSAAQIRPLLIGASVPSVMVADSDGAGVDLKVIVSGQPTILIFYRGGW